MITEAIILAGGLGTRLREAVPDLPKCMAPVAGKPFLGHLIRYFEGQGIRRFVFALGYRHSVIETFLSSEFPNLDYDRYVESELLGTGGAIQKACGLAASRQVLILNGDTYFAVNAGELSTVHENHDADCTLCLKPMAGSDRYGVVEIDNEGRISNFLEKKWYEKSLINGGVYALNAPRFLSSEWPEKFSFEKDYLEKQYSIKRMYGVVQDKYFIDIGIPDDFARAQEEMGNG